MKVTRRQKKSTIKIKKGSLADVNEPRSKRMDTSLTPKPGKKSTRILSTKRLARSSGKAVEQRTRQSRSQTKKLIESQSNNDSNVDKIYDFDMSDEDGLKQVLFPENENAENKVKGTKTYTGIKRKRKAVGEIEEEEKKAKIAKRTLRSKDGNVKLMLEKLNEKNKVKSDNDKKNKKQNNSQKDRKAEVKSHSNETNSSVKDNGVLVTPMLRSKHRKENTSDLRKATSTPSQVNVDTKKTKSAPSKGEAHIMPSPMLSPVMKLSPIDFSPKKHPQLERVERASSPDFKSPRPVDRTYSGRGSIGRFPASPIYIKETKKSSSTKKSATVERRKSSKYEDWALRMSLELEEAESYELSLD